jgi:predicted nuclease of predicted toxin-antitoxin system
VRWLADECVAAPIVARLRAMGHDVVYVAEISPAVADTDAIAHSYRDNRLLLTEDKDFGELVFRWKRLVPGLILLRTSPENNSLKWKRLNAAIERFGMQLFGRYTVIEEARFRSRLLRSLDQA